MQTAISVGKITHFKIVNELVNLLFAEQKRGNRDECGEFPGNFLIEVKFWKCLRLVESCNCPICQINCCLRGRQQKKYDCSEHRGHARKMSKHGEQRCRDDKDGEN